MIFHLSFPYPTFSSSSIVYFTVNIFTTLILQFVFAGELSQLLQQHILSFSLICLTILMIVALIIITVTVLYRRKMQQKSKRMRHFKNDVEGSVASRDPLIPGQSLRDLIDTTSGSGMLPRLWLSFCDSFLNGPLLLCRTSTFGTAKYSSSNSTFGNYW